MSALRRHHHRQRRRRRHARPPPRARRASASCCSSAATGCRASRRTGRAATCSSTNRYISPDTWYDDDGQPFQPQVHYFVGGATKLYGAALYRLRAEDFGELRHHDGISPAWPISLRRDGAVLHAGRAALPGARRPRRGPDRAAGERALPVPGASATSRASSSSPTTSRPPATTRSTRRAACCSTRRTCPTAPACAAGTCDGFPCLVHAKSDAEVLGVRPALEHPNVTLLTNADAPCAWRPTTPGTTVTGVVVERDGERRDLHRRHRRRLLRRGQHRQAAARLGQRRATRTAWPTAPTRSGATTCSTTARRCSRSPRSPTRPCSRRRSASTTSTSRPTTSTTRWATSRWSASRRPRCTAARSRSRPSSRPSWTLRDVARHAVDFWLSTEDLPRPDNRVTLRDDGSIRLAYTPTNEEPKKRLLPRAQGDARPPRACTPTT